jgi:hypothetical protein
MRPDERKSAEQFDREADKYAGRYANRDPNGHSFREHHAARSSDEHRERQRASASCGRTG